MVSKINKNTYENAEQITVINTTRIDGSEGRYKQKMEMVQDFYPSPFMGNYFCEIAHCNAAFVAISKNAVTYLKNIAIYTNTGVITTSKMKYMIGSDILQKMVIYILSDLIVKIGERI